MRAKLREKLVFFSLSLPKLPNQFSNLENFFHKRKHQKNYFQFSSYENWARKIFFSTSQITLRGTWHTEAIVCSSSSSKAKSGPSNLNECMNDDDSRNLDEDCTFHFNSQLDSNSACLSDFFIFTPQNFSTLPSTPLHPLLKCHTQSVSLIHPNGLHFQASLSLSEPAINCY